MLFVYCNRHEIKFILSYLNTETRPFAAIICQPEEREQLQDELQFNHKPTKMLFTEKGRSQTKWPNHKYNWDLLILCTRWASIWVKSSTAPPRADPWWPFLFADGTHNKKPHSPTHPNASDEKFRENRMLPEKKNFVKIAPFSFQYIETRQWNLHVDPHRPNLVLA